MLLRIARRALLLRGAQLRIKSNLDCSGLLITRLNSTTLAVWKLAGSLAARWLVVDDWFRYSRDTKTLNARAGRYKLQRPKGGHLMAIYTDHASRSTTRHPWFAASHNNANGCFGLRYRQSSLLKLGLPLEYVTEPHTDQPSVYSLTYCHSLTPCREFPDLVRAHL